MIISMEYLIKKNSTTLTRVFAILLIINSHLDVVYQNSLLASGGAIGNTLFFLISGYGLKFSYDKNRKTFFEWIKKRLIAIYPIVWLVNIFNFFFSNSSQNLTLDFFLSFIYTDYWFINAIILYYIFGYFFLQLNDKTKFLKYYLYLIIAYIVAYFTLFDIYNSFVIEAFPEKVLFYFLTFLGGVLLYHYNSLATKKPKTISLLWFFSLISYLVVKILFRDSILFKELQILQLFLQFSIAFGIVLFNFYFFKKFTLGKVLNYPLSIISNITLEIYLIHGLVVHYFLNFNVSVFLKVFYIYAVSIFVATILKIISTSIISRLIK